MKPTEDLRVRSLSPIVAPEDLKRVFPLSDRAAEHVAKSREAIKHIFSGSDARMMGVVGPCSIHDPVAAVDYARRLSALSREIADQLFLVMRVYLEKPRTTVGWKGLINDPDLDGTYQISKGLGIARRLFCEINELGLPIATETLGPINPQYMADLISWGCIGARTSESQIHREMASGLSFPLGIKNSTDGNLQHAIDAIKAAGQPHNFLGITHGGRSAIVHTTGNPDVHIVLRGGGDRPNYYPEDIARTEALLKKANLPVSIMVDCSHGNSFKNCNRQVEALESVLEQVAGGNRSIFGVMIESNIEEGSQPMLNDIGKLRYGVSITDSCVGWEQTEKMLRRAHQVLKDCGGRKIG
jgi:3-deoxy-7-phosphoheptulonate synthase